MRQFALESGSVLAQFTIYHPYPGTKDFYEMLSDKRNRTKPKFVPKHKTQLREERFWLKPMNEVDPVVHANIARDDLRNESQKCWDAFYSVKEVVKRMRRGRLASWPWAAKCTYLSFCLAFKRIYGGQGMAADGVRTRRLGVITRTIARVGIAIFNHHRHKELDASVGRPWARAACSPCREDGGTDR